MNRDDKDRSLILAADIVKDCKEKEVDVVTFALAVKMYCDKQGIDLESFARHLIKTNQMRKLMRKLMLGKYRFDIDDTEEEDE